ncbi:MAG: hypothetical protein JJT82_07455 [Legionellaceae bacterium]|nr:hypothetical protein [Legionellaceae bacterium]
MYTRADFGRDLKERVRRQEDVAEIGRWAHDEVYIEGDIDDNDVGFLRILLILAAMEDSPEDFGMSYKRLNEVADDLIAGKENINMDY